MRVERKKYKRDILRTIENKEEKNGQMILSLGKNMIVYYQKLNFVSLIFCTPPPQYLISADKNPTKVKPYEIEEV